MLAQKQKKLPRVCFKKLKKILKGCRNQHKDTVVLDRDHQIVDDGIPHGSSTFPQHCLVCDGTFFPPLLQEMSAVVRFFNEKAQKLLELYLASRCSKCVICHRSILFKSSELLSEIAEFIDFISRPAVVDLKVKTYF